MPASEKRDIVFPAFLAICVLIIVAFFGYTSWTEAREAGDLTEQAKLSLSEKKYEEAWNLAKEANAARQSKERDELVSLCYAMKTSQASYDEGLAALGNGDYEKAISAFKAVSKTHEEAYQDSQLKLKEASQKLAKIKFEEAKTLYQRKDYTTAYQTLLQCIILDPELESARKLKDTYEQAKLRQEEAQRQEAERQAKIAAEEAKKQARIAARERMKEYEFGSGVVGIAVTETKTSSRVTNDFGYYRYATDPTHDHFVWVYINACNSGSSAVHVNPNDFTLSTPNGYTANYDETSFYVNYLDATDVPPGKYIAGWLIFFVSKADSYTLHYDGWGGSVTKEIIP